tara:strand:+ start:42 stop:611 length:570 start_codon:yes stop_codon:yes gene_type:complete
MDTDNSKINHKDNNIDENKEVNDLTLKYLSNKCYTNSVNQTINENNRTSDESKINNKEIKFYRKRIMNFTKNMLREEIDLKEINSNIKESYYEYVNVLIQNFKMNDRRDVLQEEFNNFSNDISMSNNIQNDINNLENINDIIFQNKKIASTMDNFVVKSGNKKEIKIYPQEKTINLKAKHLRVKGIKNK